MRNRDKLLIYNVNGLNYDLTKIALKVYYLKFKVLFNN